MKLEEAIKTLKNAGYILKDIDNSKSAYLNERVGVEVHSHPWKTSDWPVIIDSSKDGEFEYDGKLYYIMWDYCFGAYPDDDGIDFVFTKDDIEITLIEEYPNNSSDKSTILYDSSEKESPYTLNKNSKLYTVLLNLCYEDMFKDMENGEYNEEVDNAYFQKFEI